MGTENRVAIVQHFSKRGGPNWCRVEAYDLPARTRQGKADELQKRIKGMQGEQVRQLLARTIANRGLVEQPKPPQ